MKYDGPKTPLALQLDEQKYQDPNEGFEGKVHRIAASLADDERHRRALKRIIGNQYFLPAGRVQAAVGSIRQTTAFNCFVMGTIPDSMEGIFEMLKEAALTMQMGGGIGYDFSTIRPKGDRVKSLNSDASGPLSFMYVWDAMCRTIMSAGSRRGAMMGTMRIDHPDILEFINAKTNTDNLTNFNLSLLVTDEFMTAVLHDETFDLRFEGKVYRTIRARTLWDAAMRATWDWAEPGVLYVDRMNNENNLWYCETISATNPCGEQPLPPYGACLLGSFNWVKYVKHGSGGWYFDLQHLLQDVPAVVRAMDNVIDETDFPLEKQAEEARNKRRMGLGFTGVANAMARLGLTYGTKQALEFYDEVARAFTNKAYIASAMLAAEKGAFPLFDADKYCESLFIKRLDKETQDVIRRYGIRNSHLTSIAPCGTISMTADNVSSSIEPVFAHEYVSTIRIDDVPTDVNVKDYALRTWGIRSITADELSVDAHVDTLCAAARWSDSAVSKTCNVGSNVTFAEFKDVYIKAWQGGAKGCTTFRLDGKRFGVRRVVEQEEVEEGAACYIDPATGKKSCE